MHRNDINPQLTQLKNPNLMITGVPGGGKTAVARVILTSGLLKQRPLSGGARDGVS